jgi:hypothetical protein
MLGAESFDRGAMAKEIFGSVVKVVAGIAGAVFLFYNKFTTTGFLVMGASIGILLFCAVILKYYLDDDGDCSR